MSSEKIKPSSNKIDGDDLKMTKAEYIENWTINIFIRILDNICPLIFSSLVAFAVACVSSNFDHLIRLVLQSIETIGNYRYLTSILFLCLSALIVQIGNPTVRGSGIPEMKLFLDNWESPRMIDYLSFKACTVKLVGLGLSMLSGFPIGKEGPYVHISCAVVYFAKFDVLPKLYHLFSCNCYNIIARLNFSIVRIAKQHYLQWKLQYRRNVDVYRFLCTGCALGVACTFGAPIGGVMFSIEVTSQIFNISNYWHCFYTSLAGALFFRFFIGGIFHENWFFKPFLQANLRGEEYEFFHFVVFIGIGIASGILGSIFILIYYLFFKFGQIFYRILNYFLRKFSTKNDLNPLIFHQRTSTRRIVVSVVYTLLVSVVLCVVDFILQSDYKMPLSQHGQLGFFFDDGERLMKAFKVIKNSNISNMTTVSPYQEIDLNINFHNYLLPLLSFLIMKILFFCPMIACLPVPSGIFIPLMIVGACLGRLIGDLTRISSAGCAIVGAAGLSGAVTHSVSTAVIITEMTEEVEYLIPCAISAFVGKLVAHIISKYSIYEMFMRTRQMPYMPDEDEDIFPIFRKTTSASFIASGSFISLRPTKKSRKTTTEVGGAPSNIRHRLTSLNNNLNYNHSKFLLFNNTDSRMSESSDHDKGYVVGRNIGSTIMANITTASSTNDDLRRILSLIYSYKHEMQWKMIPVVQSFNEQVILTGYIRCEAAEVYLEKYFSMLMHGSTKHRWWLKEDRDLVAIHPTDEAISSSNQPLMDESPGSLLEVSGYCCFKQSVWYNSEDWQLFLADSINWSELLEERPCSVTMTTKLPDILTFVQINLLPQVFVLNSGQLVGIITRENIIDQLKKLHHQLGRQAVSYRADLISLPMQAMMDSTMEDEPHLGRRNRQNTRRAGKLSDGKGIYSKLTMNDEEGIHRNDGDANDVDHDNVITNNE